MQTAGTDPINQRTARFWMFQALGWSPYFLFQLIFFGSDNWMSAESLVFGFSSTAIAIICSLLLRLTYKKLSDTLLGAGKWFAIVIVSCFVFALMADITHQALLYSLGQIVSGFETIHEQQPLLAKTFILFFVYLFWSGFYLIITRQEKLNNAFLHQQSTELLLKETQLTKLLEQLNPHFMFNTINNIRALILRDTDKARDMLSRFSDIMRYQLNVDDQSLVALGDELQFVRDYVELVRLQLGDRLLYTEDIDDSLLQHQVPRMSLQLLVENALKHGINKSDQPGRIVISINRGKECWVIIVGNDGKLTDDQTDSGVGLKNLKERLKLSFGDQCTFSLAQSGDLVESSMVFTEHTDGQND